MKEAANLIKSMEVIRHAKSLLRKDFNELIYDDAVWLRPTILEARMTFVVN